MMAVGIALAYRPACTVNKYADYRILAFNERKA